MLHKLVLYRLLVISLGVFGSGMVAVAPAQAGRYVLNQSFSTIERYFGRHLTESKRQQGNEVLTERTYSNTRLRRMIPNLPANAKFKVIFVNGKAQWIALVPATGAGIPVEDKAWQAFVYDRATAFNFFEYIFGYRPPTYTPVPGYYGGGHEGFYDNRICLGDGIQTTYTEYISGVGDIQLSYTPECEPF
ncbi:MAG TPA: hypothetical protein IGS53_14435 [Leptolyngbyaceae cyanobacterium M33_DOE_097]|uniref:Uncharacterized protein n=1 Tax=Oscillatoriales cyanobacterium SpSt-418 TaxID=2282169 RepID=A0A7C3PEC6_9CYAN|nr:hypothetical protein [Leptolyngbyaceae cyanobacterium M33_DOE_097]